MSEFRIGSSGHGQLFLKMSRQAKDINRVHAGSMPWTLAHLRADICLDHDEGHCRFPDSC